VANFRSSRGAEASANEAPQLLQNFDPAGFSVRQDEQVAMAEAYAAAFMPGRLWTAHLPNRSTDFASGRRVRGR
jgi:hypothetical protein